jgi:putative hydrolase of the HAD superfamily
VPAVIPANARAVFFDAVGTLLFPEPGAPEIYAAVAARHGLNLSGAEVRSRFLAAFRAEEDMDRLAGWVTSEAREVDRWRRIVSETLAGVAGPEACFRELFDHFSRPGAWRVDPHARSVLATLHERGLVLGLGSNYDARLWSVLRGFPELAPLRDRVVVSAAVGFRKPAEEFFREVARVAGCERGEVVFVGDDFDNDYRGATAAGLIGVHLDPRDKHTRAKRRISDLLQLLG